MAQTSRFFLLPLVLYHLAEVINCQDCFGQSTFIIQAGYEPESRIVAEQAVTSLDDCLLSCSDRVSSCKAAIFKNVHKDAAPLCQMLEAGVADRNLIQSKDQAMYYAEKICLPTLQHFCDNTWSFEAVSTVGITAENFISETRVGISLEECLVECLKKADCHSAFFNQKTSECRLAEISRHSVRFFDDHFEMGTDWSMYENNCIHSKLNAEKCQFFKTRSEGMPLMFDAMQSGISTMDDCQRICLELTGTVCRSYTFDRKGNSCYLSHSTMRNLIAVATDRREAKKRLKVKDSNLEMGDLEDCYNFELKCKHDGMLIKGDSMRLFNGDLMSKNDKNCKTVLSDAYTFQAEVPYKKCGTKKSALGTYTNLMFLKDGGTPLITVRDKLIQVICRIFDGEDIPVSYRLNIKGNQSRNDDIERQQALVVSPSIPLVVGPRFNLKVLDSGKKPAKQVKLGDTGYLEISYVDAKDTKHNGSSGIEVTNLFASDVNGSINVQLYDHDGCPVAQDASALELEDGKVRAKIKFSGFPDLTKIYYKGLVRPCIGPCKPAVLLVLCFSIGYFYCKRYRWRRRMRPNQTAPHNIEYVINSPEAAGTYTHIK